MSATKLPLEIQQHVFSYLDTKTFHAARAVCRWWRYASLETITLRKQLRKLPICPTVMVAGMRPGDLHFLFNEAACALMLGVSISRVSIGLGPQSTLPCVEDLDLPSVVATPDGQRVVIVRDRKITRLDTNGGQTVTLTERPINDLQETVGNGPWLKSLSASSYQLSISADGSLLAIAQERTIQIYDLNAKPDSFTANEYISSAAGQCICGLGFEQNGFVLRVRLSGGGTVVYLGTPPDVSGTTADIDHWKSKAGLRHVLLDTSLLALNPSAASQGHPEVISSLQILEPFQHGFLFAAQHHGGGESSYYIIGHVRCASMSKNDASLHFETDNATVLVRCEGFLSAWAYTVNATGDNGLGLYENMPCVHEHHPGFALSPAGDFLVVAEQDKKAVRHMTYTQIFLYRLPTFAQLTTTLSTSDDRRKNIYNGIDETRTMAQLSQSTLKERVARIPQCLTTLQGQVTMLKFETVPSVNRVTLKLVVSTAETTHAWLLENKA
nr:hypothetical protein CFP56_00861 [Quercus suber]